MSKTEVVKAIYAMTKGAVMSKTKTGIMGRQHLRKFRLSRDLTYLQWESQKKDPDKSAVPIADMKKLVKGQKTKEGSQKNKESGQTPQLESLSFSVEYTSGQGTRTLDITCKDEQMFEIWTTGLEALISGFSDKQGVDELCEKEENQDEVDADKVKIESGPFGFALNSYKEDTSDLYTWGEGTKGKLGHREDTEENEPRVVEALSGQDIRLIACGTQHTMAVSKKGDLFSWGCGNGGRLGQGHLRDRFTPLHVDSLDDAVVFVACHEFHSAAICAKGELYTWGKAGGRLGYECEGRKQLTPRCITSLLQHKVIHVSCGRKHTLACTRSGKVFSFGDNEFGQLGIEGVTERRTPSQVDHLEKLNIVSVACGRYHSAAISGEGSLSLWGCNESGQVGKGDLENSCTPFTLSCTPDFKHKCVVKVDCGGEHTVFLTMKGDVYAMGDNQEGQLGIKPSNGTTNQLLRYCCPAEVNIPSSAKPVHVSCGDYHTALITDTGQLYTWGKGDGGRLGHGDNKNRSVPCEVESIQYHRVRYVSCGAGHTACAVTNSWIPNDEVKNCMACKLKFFPVRRKYHCRNCGGIFCDKCSSNQTPVPHLGYNTPQRVCERCYSFMAEILRKEEFV